MRIQEVISEAKKDSDISSITRVHIRIGSRYEFEVPFEELDEAVNYGSIW